MAARQKCGDNGVDQVGFADDALLHILFKGFDFFIHEGSPFDETWGESGGQVRLSQGDRSGDSIEWW